MPPTTHAGRTTTAGIGIEPATHVHAVFIRRQHRDRGHLVELGHIVDAVGLTAIATHVVDDAAARDDETVPALLDPLHVPDRTVARIGRPVDLDLGHLPQP